MSFDKDHLLKLVAVYGAIVRIVVADTQGSAPRGGGTSMVVWRDGQTGTIGGGALEFEAVLTARDLLDGPARCRVDRIALGPARGQCCGGAVTLVSERFHDNDLQAITGPIYARAISSNSNMPLSVSRMLAEARRGLPNTGQLVDGWMVEPLSTKQVPLWIYGAGHVGRALIDVLSPLPRFHLTWVDTSTNRFPDDIPEGVEQLIAENPADVVRYAPHQAHHLIVTYSHTLDLELCHRLLGHSFASAGLIGSKTKWARFRNRLTELGHDDAQILRIRCPIGQPELGKHPQAIAIGVTAELLRQQEKQETVKDARG